jgi:hypothetical protein
MNPTRLFAILLLVSLVSCQSKSAFDYSEAIVRMERELSADIAEADQKLLAYMDARRADSAVMMSKHMEALAEDKLNEVEKLKVPLVNEGDNFKKSAVRYFAYIKSIYTAFRKFTMAATAAEKEKERKKLAKIIGEKSEITKDMQEAQRKFAIANNFLIEKK